MFSQLLEKIALGLEDRHIPYMIIGGQAVLIYGEPRLTRDIDVTLGVGPDRLADLLAFARSHSWRVLVEDPEQFVQRTMVLPLEDSQSSIRIDLILSFSPYERQALERVHRVGIGKAAVRFASPEDVIVHKIIAGRPRDLEDVRSILNKRVDFDRAYVLQWLSEFDRSLGGTYRQAFEGLEQSLV
jgi:predicted nucleotidyltransferase